MLECLLVVLCHNMSGGHAHWLSACCKQQDMVAADSLRQGAMLAAPTAAVESWLEAGHLLVTACLVVTCAVSAQLPHTYCNNQLTATALLMRLEQCAHSSLVTCAGACVL
jgi:hypothetical protein